MREKETHNCLIKIKSKSLILYNYMSLGSSAVSAIVKIAYMLIQSVEQERF